MSKVPFIPFAEVKQAITIEQVANYLSLPLKRDGKGFRCECPVHGQGKRSLVVSPNVADSKGDVGSWYCHASEEGGDRLSLLAHIRQIKPYAAVLELAEQFAPHLLPNTKKAEPKPRQKEEKVTVPEEKEETPAPITSKGERGFQPLPYLDYDHETVRAIGLEPEDAKALGLGYAPRGVHRGRLAIPVRSTSGVIVGYIGVVNPSTANKWHF